jgi:uncharacterized protein
MVYMYAVMLTLLNLVFWFSIMFNLPGIWLMILFPVILEWWQPGQFMFSWTVLFVAVGFAVLGEVIEFIMGAAGSHYVGGSKRAAALAIVGAFIGGIVGTALPVPILGTLIGACVGAFVGSMVGDVWAGRSLSLSLETGQGAAVGRFWGTIMKLSVGAIIWFMLALAAFF